jgi:hypothetical protein
VFCAFAFDQHLISNVDSGYPLYHCIQNASGTHPGSYQMVTTASFTEVKALGHEADHLRLSTAEQ